MSNWAVRGAKVVCVDDVICVAWHLRPIGKLIKHGVYTIRDVGLSRANPGMIILRLVEISNPESPRWKHEYGYRLHRFRPLITRSHEEDMTVFRKIASNLPTAKELEDSVQLALERLG